MPSTGLFIQDFLILHLSFPLNPDIIKMDDEWYELRLTEEFQQDILREHYPDLRYTRLIGPQSRRSSDLEYVEIYHWIECPICDSKCSVHEYKHGYSLHESIHGDPEAIDEEFLYMAVDLGGKLSRGKEDVTREYRVKLV